MIIKYEARVCFFRQLKNKVMDASSSVQTFFDTFKKGILVGIFFIHFKHFGCDCNNFDGIYYVEFSLVLSLE